MIKVKDSIEKNLSDSVFLVEATSTEKFFLWVDHSPESDRPRFPVKKWEEASVGYGETIGYLDKRPVVVMFSWARIDGHLVTFYEATSQVVDYEMVEKWLKEKFKGTYDNGHRRARCDAMNFQHCLSAIKELNGN